MAKRGLWTATAAVFVACLAFGIWFACRRPLWNDEIYTLYNSILSRGYGQILVAPFGSASTEGNDSPVFYLTQKLWMALIRYQPLPAPSTQSLSDTYSQVMLRLPWIAVFSAAVALLFQFFARFYSLGTGLLALLVFLSSPIVYTYWTEMRPYGLWIFLSTVQSLALLRILMLGGCTPALRRLLAGVHWLLALTIFLSAIQIVGAMILLWLLGQRRISYLVLAVAGPVALCLAYYLAAQSHYGYHLEDAANVLLGSFFKSRVLFLGIMAAACVWYRAMLGKQLPWLVFTGSLLAAAVLMLIHVQLKTNPAHPGFLFPSRYFLFLLLPGVVMVTYFLAELRRRQAPLALQGAGWLLVGYQVLRAVLDLRHG